MGWGFTYLRAHCVSSGEKEVGFTEKEGAAGRVLAGPSAASASWTPLPFPGSGPGLFSPVATQWRQKKKKGGLRAVRL